MRIIIAATSLFLVAGSARADTASEVEQLLAAYRSAWAAADAKGLARLYAKDAELVGIAATAEGSEQIRQLYEAAFAGGMAGSKLETRIEHVTEVTSATVYGRGDFRIVPASSSAPGCGRFVAVLQRTDNGWRIAAFNETTLACSEVAP